MFMFMDKNRIMKVTNGNKLPASGHPMPGSSFTGGMTGDEYGIITHRFVP